MQLLFNPADYFLQERSSDLKEARGHYQQSVAYSRIAGEQAKNVTLAVVSSPTGLGIAFGMGCIKGLDSDSSVKTHSMGLLNRVLVNLL